MTDRIQPDHFGKAEEPLRGRGSTEGASEVYKVSGKIMLSAIVLLFAAIVLMVGLHLYARWYLLRARRRRLLLRHRRGAHIVFYVDPATDPVAGARGLDPAVLASLPLFAYPPESHPPDPEACLSECAVCLSEFEEKDTCRRLPRCGHSFHVACIDMWLHSHSSCPLCRAPVVDDCQAPVPPQDQQQNHVAISVAAADSEPPTAASQLGDSPTQCQHDDSTAAASSSSLGARRKATDLVGVSIQVPGRSTAVFGRSQDESGLGSPSPAFKSPGGGRMRSLKRMVSRDIRAAAAALISPSSAPSCSSVPSEADLERGRVEETQQTRAQTPR